MILTKIIFTIVCLTWICVVGNEDNMDVNTRIEQFQQSVMDNTQLESDKQHAVLDRLSKFKDSLHSLDVPADLGTEGGSKHYKTELGLLAAYFEAGLPMDSGFGKWLKEDLRKQVDAAYDHVMEQKDLTEDKRKERKMILDELRYDPLNLGGAMDTEKMLEHADWLDDNYTGFSRRSKGLLGAVKKKLKTGIEVGVEIVKTGGSVYKAVREGFIEHNKPKHNNIQ